VLGFDADLAAAANERELWAHAEALLPAHEVREAMPRYTQGLMDLGATVCISRRPACLVCPVRDMCAARGEGRQEHYPVRTRKLKRSAQSLWLLLAGKADGSVWLEKRPASGIWAGLYCLPAFDTLESLQAAVPQAARGRLHERAAFLHVLTHKDLHLHPVIAKVAGPAMRHREGAWFAPAQWPQLGLPAPVRGLLGTTTPAHEGTACASRQAANPDS
jgi:A/G-specific adenine glycosylase